MSGRGGARRRRPTSASAATSASSTKKDKCARGNSPGRYRSGVLRGLQARRSRRDRLCLRAHRSRRRRRRRGPPSRGRRRVRRRRRRRVPSRAEASHSREAEAPLSREAPSPWANNRALSRVSPPRGRAWARCSPGWASAHRRASAPASPGSPFWALPRSRRNPARARAFRRATRASSPRTARRSCAAATPRV